MSAYEDLLLTDDEEECVPKPRPKGVEYSRRIDLLLDCDIVSAVEDWEDRIWWRKHILARLRDDVLGQFKIDYSVTIKPVLDYKYSLRRVHEYLTTKKNTTFNKEIVKMLHSFLGQDTKY